MASIRKNLGYSIILTISNYLFPLITYPYVSRVLGVDRIGFCAYVDSIINVVSLFAMMGVSYVGLRAIAQNKDSREEMSSIFSNLFTINLILCILSLLVFNIGLAFIGDLGEYKEYIIWGEFKILFTIFLIEWLYRGLEDFKYITIRSIAIKLVYVILIYLLVRRKDDMFIYYLLSIFLIAGNFIFNWIHKRHYIDFSFKQLQLKKYFPKVMSMGAYTILTSVYATFNITMLGYLSNNTQVGYYNTSLKIFHILVALLTAYSSVMLPRMSSMVVSNTKEEIQKQVNTIFDIVFVIVLPLVYFFFVYAEESVTLMSGVEYLQSTVSLKLLMLLLLPFAIDQILVLQILMPYKKDNAILVNTVIASAIAVITMFIILPSKGAAGSAFVLLLSEIIIMALSMVYTQKHLCIAIPYRALIRRILYSMPYIVLFLLAHSIDSFSLRIIVALFLGVLYFSIERIITRDALYIQLLTIYQRLCQR